VRDVALQIQKTMAVRFGDPLGALGRRMIAGRFLVQTLASGLPRRHELDF
jgi:hypothetical protein